MENNYHYVYITTNNINGKKYIGKHSTKNLDDGYVGSGKILAFAVKKYGIDNFTTEIIKFFDDQESAYLYEKSIITEEIIKDPIYYNLKFGGLGAGLYKPVKKKYYNNGIHTITKNEDEPCPDGYVRGKLYSTTKDTKWITDGKNSILIKNGDDIPEGYSYGHSFLNKERDYFFVNNGIQNFKIKNGEQIPDGCVIGKFVKPTTTGTFWVNNGYQNKLIKKDGLIPEGFVRGRLLNKNKFGQFSKKV